MAFFQYIYTRDHRPPRYATHVTIHESVNIIPANLFCRHPNIIEVTCHENVERIEQWAFFGCRRLKRVRMLGVGIVEFKAFANCPVLEDVDCPKLEVIREHAFSNCPLLSSIDLTCVKIVEEYALQNCQLSHAKFGGNLESIRDLAFANNLSLERITIPLKAGVLMGDYIFDRCTKLKRVNLVEEAVILECLDALLLDESWKDDVATEMESIRHILPEAPSREFGGKATVINEWVGNVLRKIRRCKRMHVELLNEASAALQLSLPEDIVVKNVLKYLEYPSILVLDEISVSLEGLTIG